MPTYISRWRPRRIAPAPSPSTTVFAFSGGGINGAAQIGMLEELYVRGITPDAVVGVSVGALNAILLAADPARWSERMKAAWQYAASSGVFARSSQSRVLWALARQHQSLDPGRLLRDVIRTNLPLEHIEDCALPLRVGTTTLDDGQTHWHDAGPAYEILLASCAVPGVLPPVQMQGRLHVDGSICSPLPLRAALEFAPTRLIILDVSSPIEASPTPSTALTVLLRSFELTRVRALLTEFASLPSELEIIHIKASSPGGLTTATPARVDQLIDQGRLAARTLLDSLPQLSSRPLAPQNT